MQKIKMKTLADISKLAGVSESTVSRALSNNPLISLKTRERIQAIAQENNFRINTSARNLRLQKTNTIAVIILFNADSDQSISDPFLLSIVGTIAEQLGQHGYDMLLNTTRSMVDDWQHHYFDTRRADGVIVIGQGENDERVRNLAEAGHPFVAWGAYTDAYVTVGSDNRKGGYLATRHLLEQGCQRIAFMGQTNHTEIHARWEGYVQALTEAGVDQAQIEADSLRVQFTGQSGYKVVQDRLRADNFPYDGLFSATDGMALGAMKALKEGGLNIPQDVAVVGFDDIAVSALYHPSLTTVRQDTTAGGKLLVEKLLSKLRNDETSSQMLTTQLVIRQSSQRR